MGFSLFHGVVGSISAASNGVPLGGTLTDTTVVKPSRDREVPTHRVTPTDLGIQGSYRDHGVAHHAVTDRHRTETAPNRAVSLHARALARANHIADHLIHDRSVPSDFIDRGDGNPSTAVVISHRALTDGGYGRTV